MATVRLTQSLNSNVLYKLRQGFDTRRMQLHKQFTALLNAEALSVAVREAFLATHGMSEDIIAKVPRGWFTTCEALTLIRINGVDVPRGWGSVKTPNLPHPQAKSPAYGVQLNHPRLEPFKQLFVDAGASLTTLLEEQRKAEQAVNSIFQRCTTLRQALELWPGIMDLLPAETIQRHNEPPEKREASKPTLAQDSVDILNTAAVKNKLATAAAQ